MLMARNIRKVDHETMFTLARNTMHVPAMPGRVVCYNFFDYPADTQHCGQSVGYRNNAALPGNCMAGVVVRPIPPGAWGYVQIHGWVSELVVSCVYNFTEAHLDNMILYPFYTGDNEAVSAGVVTTSVWGGVTHLLGSHANVAGYLHLCSSSYLRQVFTLGTNTSGLVFSAYVRMG